MKVTTKPFALGSNSADGRHDAHVGVAALEIELAQQIAIRLDTVRIVEVVASDPAQPVGLAGLDDVLQAVVGIGPVADEVDLLTRRSWRPR